MGNEKNEERQKDSASDLHKGIINAHKLKNSAREFLRFLEDERIGTEKIYELTEGKDKSWYKLGESGNKVVIYKDNGTRFVAYMHEGKDFVIGLRVNRFENYARVVLRFEKVLEGYISAEPDERDSEHVWQGRSFIREKGLEGKAGYYSRALDEIRRISRMRVEI